MRRQVGSASDAPTRGRRRRSGGGTPRHIGSSSACRRPVLLDGEPGRILGLDLGSARVARRDTGARRSNSRGPPGSGESHRSEPAAKPISSGGRTCCTQPGRLIAFGGRTRIGRRGSRWNHLGSRHVGRDRGLDPRHPRGAAGDLELGTSTELCARTYARGGPGSSGGVFATTGRCM